MYFKLYCISRLPDTSHNEIEHAVEILFNSYEEIPLLWAKRLETLKKAPVSSG
jgi:hypothetical protein